MLVRRAPWAWETIGLYGRLFRTPIPPTAGISYGIWNCLGSLLNNAQKRFTTLLLRRPTLCPRLCMRRPARRETLSGKGGPEN